ncbi:glycosyltransferase [Naasia sp. SYSU D00948]|uniref:glycosyltransferase n=1 Tax=Naasia sp. SYSU D00948 TaxID=2817379 RepID=UPI001B314ABD|nr:glycosyltransferase [Naasia sp. SYSU D00948]
MPKFLIATHPITGHMLPGIPIVRELVRRGHEVHWYCGRKFREQAEAAGARYEPYRQAYDFDDSDYNRAFPGRANLSGLDQIRFDFLHLFMRQIAAQHRDLTRVLAQFPADAVVGDTAMHAVLTLTETGGPPNAIYNVSCLGLPGREVAPFGLGRLPSATLPGRMRNRVLRTVASRVVFGAVSVELAQQCVAVGAAPRAFDGPPASPYLYLQPSVPGFEYPRSDLPPQVHFVGSLVPPAPDVALPEWWEEATTSERPVVLVTQGTVATRLRDLALPAIRGLAGEDVLVVVAGVRQPEALGSLPANVRTAPFVPFGPLFPHVAAFVTNGGYGGVQYALSSGVPIVAAGTTEDKAEVANRISYSGVGINLRTATPRPGQVRDAVRTVLSEPGYRERARELRDELAAHDGPAESAGLLERLAATRRAVFR